MRLTTNLPSTSNPAGGQLFEVAGLCASGRERGGAANIFQSARTGRPARGYGLGPAELLGYCARMRNTFPCRPWRRRRHLAALDDEKHLQRVVENNAIQSRDLSQGLSALGYRVVPTAANFLYAI